MPGQALARRSGGERLGLDAAGPDHRELADRGDRLLAVGQALGALGIAGVEHLGDVLGHDGLRHATELLDLLEFLPGGVGQAAT